MTSPLILSMTTGIIANYVSKNRVGPDELPDLVRSVSAALVATATPEPAPEVSVQMPTAAQVRKSITDQGLISFIDGRPYKSLRRHLSNHDLTPAKYREQFGLPSSYPMVSPHYSARRSEIARSLGLGRKAPSAPDTPVAEHPPKKPTKKRLAEAQAPTSEASAEPTNPE